MIVRKANLGDLDKLALLFDAYRVFYRKESDKVGAVRFLTERMSKEESVIFVVEENNTLLGFVQLYPIFSSTRMKRLWLLNDLFVSENQRGRGISKKLIEQSKMHVIETGACGLTLETEISNVVGNNLYPATGFVKDEEHYFYAWDVA